MQRAIVTHAYTTSYPEPLRLTQGARVDIGDRESEWPGWLWCTAADGTQGWVPASWLKRTGATGILLRDYDATELTAPKGETVAVLSAEAGWYWCRTDDGRVGWLPAEHLKMEL